VDVGVAKRNGAYYTPTAVARSLVRWAVRSDRDEMLDPSCGDGRFLEHHARHFGVDRDPHAVTTATQRVRGGTICCADFFEWARQTRKRFDCVVGNPPFIRYQRFSGETRRRALDMARGLGADFSQLASSWAPFLVVAAGMLSPGGRIAFVVPAEIGHATYAKPLLQFLGVVPLRRASAAELER